jgi:hypothetical protein
LPVGSKLCPEKDAQQELGDAASNNTTDNLVDVGNELRQYSGHAPRPYLPHYMSVAEKGDMYSIYEQLTTDIMSVR